MPDPNANPFPFVALDVLDARVQVEAVMRTLTRVMELVVLPQTGVEPHDYSDSLRMCNAAAARQLEALKESLARVADGSNALASRVEGGEDLSAFDQTPPWLVRKVTGERRTRTDRRIVDRRAATPQAGRQ